MENDLTLRIITLHFNPHNACKNKKVHDIVVKLDLCGTQTLMHLLVAIQGFTFPTF
jgi:hypothetical protein